MLSPLGRSLISSFSTPLKANSKTTYINAHKTIDIIIPFEGMYALIIKRCIMLDANTEIDAEKIGLIKILRMLGKNPVYFTTKYKFMHIIVA